MLPLHLPFATFAKNGRIRDNPTAKEFGVHTNKLFDEVYTTGVSIIMRGIAAGATVANLFFLAGSAVSPFVVKIIQFATSRA